MRINHNIASLNTYSRLVGATQEQGKSLEKLSSGLRINKAGDDAAGLAISEKMRGQIRGLDQGSRNAQDGISLIQTAEGALNETHSILQRMRELSVQSSNDTATQDDRNKIQAEVDQLAKEITRVSNTTEFNTKKLLDGGVKSGNIGDLTFQIGANAGQSVSLSINAMDAQSLGVAGVQATASVTNSVSGAIASATVARDVGTGVVDGATINMSVTDVTAAVGTTGAQAVGTVCSATTVTVATVGNTSALNGYTVKFTDNASPIATTIDTTNKTITVAADFNAGACAAPANGAAIAASINTALGQSGFTDTVAVTIGGSAQMASLACDLAATGFAVAGGSDGSLTRVCISGEETLIKDTETSFTINSGSYKGLTVNMAAGKTAGDLAGNTGQVTIDATGSTAATFTSGTLTNAATAGAGINVSSQSAANSAITTIDNAIKTVSEERSKLGAMQNRLEHTINNLGTSSENLTAAESRIRDVDMAKEMMNFSKNNILNQAATAMLAQANQQPQGVLQLLR